MAARQMEEIIAEAHARPLPDPDAAYEDLSRCQVRIMTLRERMSTLNGLGARPFGVWHRGEGDEMATILARTRSELEGAVSRGAVRVEPIR